MSEIYKIGYVDENINQVKLYKRKLRDHGFLVVGYEFIKGMSPEDLMSQILASDIDLLMIDYKLNESNIVSFNGDKIESLIYDKRPLFPHIIFTNKVDQAEPYVEDWKIIFDKDEIFSEEEEDQIVVERFITTLKKSIEQYRNHISNKKKTLSILLEKAKHENLTSVDKNNLLELQEELRILGRFEVNEVPRQLLVKENLENIASLKSEAEDFLKALIEKRKNK